MARPFDSLTMTQSRMCGLFVFIDHLMSKYQKTDAHKEKQLKIIDTLLQNGPKIHVAIHHAKKEDIPVFLQKMFSNASQLKNNPPLINRSFKNALSVSKRAFRPFSA